MLFLRQSVAAAVLVLLTLSLQSAGMAALIEWIRAHAKRGLHKLGPFRSAALVVRITVLMIVLHTLEILLWAAFFRWNSFPSWESAFYFSTTTFSTVGYGDLVLSHAGLPLRRSRRFAPGRIHHRRGGNRKACTGRRVYRQADLLVVLQRRSAALIGFGMHETEAAGAVQGATVRSGDHRPVYPLSFRQLEEIMAERNLSVDHVTIWQSAGNLPSLADTNGSLFRHSCGARVLLASAE
jgi:Ion channel